MSLKKYLDFIKEKPDLFENHSNGGIKIIHDPEEISRIQDDVYEHRLNQGMDVSDTRVGLLARDPYMTVVRDAVRFSDGSPGLYNRILETSPVAILPVFKGQPVLIKVFRHGLRDWSLEFPRGAADPGETLEEAARRELYEEIGGQTVHIKSLGTFTPGGSSLSIKAELFFAEVDALGPSDPLESIISVKPYSVSEVENFIAKNEIIDGFTMALFLRARLKGLI